MSEAKEDRPSTSRSPNAVAPNGAITLAEFMKLSDRERIQFYEMGKEYCNNPQEWMDNTNLSFNYSVYRDTMKNLGWYRVGKENVAKWILDTRVMLKRLKDTNGDFSMFENLVADLDISVGTEPEDGSNIISSQIVSSDPLADNLSTLDGYTKTKNRNFSLYSELDKKLNLLSDSKWAMSFSKTSLINLAVLRLINDIENENIGRSNNLKQRLHFEKQEKE